MNPKVMLKLLWLHPFVENVYDMGTVMSNCYEEGGAMPLFYAAISSWRTTSIETG
jgi:hypothetical protein